MTDAPDSPPPPAERPRSRVRRTEGAARPRKARRRAFFSIGEVCRMMELKPHVLRYWETQFPGLSPTKNRAGNRVYTQEEVELIALIKRLVHDQRYTIQGARLKLKEMEGEGRTAAESSRALEESFLASLREELDALLELLDPSSIAAREAGEPE